MLLDEQWNPSKLEYIQKRWEELKIPANGEIAAEDAARLQLAYQSFAEELTVLKHQALLYEKRCKYERENAYTLAFLKSQKSSDRQRDIDAKNDTEVRAAEQRLFRAETYRQLLSDKREDAIRSHYALRAVLRDKSEESSFFS